MPEILAGLAIIVMIWLAHEPDAMDHPVTKPDTQPVRCPCCLRFFAVHVDPEGKVRVIDLPDSESPKIPAHPAHGAGVTGDPNGRRITAKDVLTNARSDWAFGTFNEIPRSPSSAEPQRPTPESSAGSTAT